MHYNRTTSLFAPRYVFCVNLQRQSLYVFDKICMLQWYVYCTLVHSSTLK